MFGFLSSSGGPSCAPSFVVDVDEFVSAAELAGQDIDHKAAVLALLFWGFEEYLFQ
jgi:hypothetical protein